MPYYLDGIVSKILHVCQEGNRIIMKLFNIPAKEMAEQMLSVQINKIKANSKRFLLHNNKIQQKAKELSISLINEDLSSLDIIKRHKLDKVNLDIEKYLKNVKKKIELLPKSFATNINRQSIERKVVNCITLKQAELQWQYFYYPDCWTVETPIKSVWSWQSMWYRYQFVIRRDCYDIIHNTIHKKLEELLNWLTNPIRI